MKPGLTIDDLVAVYGLTVRAMSSRKPRDPVERDLLVASGDAVVARETDGLTRVCGERPSRLLTSGGE